jgi:hypothetical protein
MKGFSLIFQCESDFSEYITHRQRSEAMQPCVVVHLPSPRRAFPHREPGVDPCPPLMAPHHFEPLKPGNYRVLWPGTWLPT